MFRPRLEILPYAQRALWPELAAIPDHFALYGGTALALRLGHRVSLDFDFFSGLPFDPDRLADSLPFLDGAERVQVDENTLTCRVERGGPVLVSFFGGLRLGQAAPHELAEGGRINVASLLDLAATKLAVLQKRAQERDYVDLDALLRHGIALPTGLAAGRAVYGQGFNPMIALKALSYFGDVPGLTEKIRRRLAAAVAAVDPTDLPSIAAYRSHAHEADESS